MALRDRRSLLLGLVTAVVMWLLVGFLAQYTMVLPLLTWDALPLSSRAWLLVQIGMLWPFAFDPVTAIVMTLTILTTGANTTMLAYLWRWRSTTFHGVHTVTGSSLLSLLGVGCVSCGTTTLSLLLGTTVSSVLIGFLPLAGREFSLLALPLGLFVFVRLARDIAKDLSCRHQGAFLLRKE